MCGRFTLTEDDLVALARRWGAEVESGLAERWRPRFNVAPGDRHVALVGPPGRRRLISATFGLAGPGPGPLLVNARVETASSRATFREAWRCRRAAVPADGFFEWEGPRSSRRPTWFHGGTGAPMLLAALLGPAHGGQLGFVVLTTEARPPVRALHDRMPVFVPPSHLDAWLAGPPPSLPEEAEPLVARAVSARVNAVEHDDPACLEEAEPPRQRSLF